MQCIVFRLSIFTMQIIDVGYIFCEINVEQKELKTLFNTVEAP